MCSSVYVLQENLVSIKQKVKKNTMSVSACLTQYTKVVEEMSHKIEQLQEELAEARRICRCRSTKVDATTETTVSLRLDF